MLREENGPGLVEHHMSRTAVHHDAALLPEHAPTPEEIRLQLQSILDSPAFHGSKRSRQFLEYVCEKSLTGEVGALKERSLAVEVFGRSPQSDLGEDTIVRVGAREVRKRLAQYYVMPESTEAKVRIDLPPGSYAAEFRYAAVHKESDPSPAPAVAMVEEHRRPRWVLTVVWALALLLAVSVVVIAVGKWTGANPNAEAFRRFWAPVLQAREPLLLAVGHPLVYHASARALKKSEERLPPPLVPMQRPIQLPPNEVDGSDLVPVHNQYVGFGDMIVATEVSAMLARQSHGARVRMASSLGFADLRQTQTLLIGAITNRWTMELQQGWRFQFSRTPELKTLILDTAQNPRSWSIPSRADGSASEDYFLICRIHNSITGRLLMAGAGLKQFGTEAAGRLLTDPDQLGVILRNLPAGWETKNLQVVLHAKVIGNTPAQPEVVASHVW